MPKYSKDQFKESLDHEIEQWFKNYRTLMSKVESDAMQSLPAKAKSIAAISIVKDVSTIVKDAAPTGSDIQVVMGSPKYSFALFLLDYAAQLYDAHFKNQLELAKAQKGMAYTQVFNDYLKKLDDLEDDYQSYGWYKSILEQCSNYLDSVEVKFPGGQDQGHDKTFLNDFVENLGIVPSVDELYERMMKNGFGQVIGNTKNIFECSYHMPRNLLSGIARSTVGPTPLPPIIAFSRGNSFPSDLNQKQRSRITFWKGYEKDWYFIEAHENMSEKDKLRQDVVLSYAGTSEVRRIKYTIRSAPLGSFGDTKFYSQEICWVRGKSRPARKGLSAKTAVPKFKSDVLTKAFDTARQYMNHRYGYRIEITSLHMPPDDLRSSSPPVSPGPRDAWGASSDFGE